MSKKYEAVIFDLDGVLCTTDQFHYLAWKALADREGIYFDEAINQRLRDVSRMESLQIILERAQRPYSEDARSALAAFKNDTYRALLERMRPSDVSDDVRRTLEALRRKGYLLAVGSSSKNAQLILEKTELACSFDAAADGNDIAHSKPNPEVFLLAAQRLRRDPIRVPCCGGRLCRNGSGAAGRI